MRRERVKYIILLLITIILGIGSRKFPEIFPAFLSLYLGDTLWALMVFFLFGFLLTDLSSLKIAILSLAFSYAIELSQIYHAPMIDSIRETTLGGLILGFGFLWSDLVCYTLGILLGIGIEFLFQTRLKRHLSSKN